MKTKAHCFPVTLKFNPTKNKYEKSPAVPRGTDWRAYQATDDEWKTAKNYGIVIPSGVVCIDIDSQKGAAPDKIDTALECQLDWQGSLVQHTPSGGTHHFFTIPHGAQLRQGNDLLGVIGFDTRCSGRGWICAGERYTDETLTGLPEAAAVEPWPDLPLRALDRLRGGDGEETGVESDLEALVRLRPVIEGLTVNEAKDYLAKLPLGDVDQYDSWVRVGMALWHQYEGSPEGVGLWDWWSKRSKSYDPKEIRTKWKSFGRHSSPITFATIIHRAGGVKAINRTDLDGLLEEARNIDDLEKYSSFKCKVVEINTSALPGDFRAMIASEIAGGFGRKAGLTKADIKAGITPRRKGNAHKGNAPSWLTPWVYVQSTGEFANTKTKRTIGHRAFDATYSREQECLYAEKAASTYATITCPIPVVTDMMFWPEAGDIFEHQGLDYANTYRPSGVEPCQTIDADGQSVIDLFLRHVEVTLEKREEQEILLDWLAWVIQHPGVRVQWALVLQGAQGTGKSYFVQVLQMILGALVSNLEPAAVAGRFTGWAHGSLVVAVEEIRIHGTSKHEILDRLKPFLTNPTVMIEEKGRDHRTVPNFSSYLMLTNHKDAIPITHGDRRYCILFSRIQSEQELYGAMGGRAGVGAYFDKLFGETRRRADALSAYFRARAISKNFDAFGRAPETDARRQMIETSISPERQSIEDALLQHECSVISETVLDVTYLTELSKVEGPDLPHPRAVGAILREMGWEPVDGRRVKLSGPARYHYIWQRRGGDAEGILEAVKLFHRDQVVPF